MNRTSLLYLLCGKPEALLMLSGNREPACVDRVRTDMGYVIHQQVLSANQTIILCLIVA